MPSDDIIEALEKQDWDTILPNLVIHERGRLLGKTVPSHFGPGDFVQEAYKRLYNGKRNWNPKKDPDLLKYLNSVIDSLISAAIKSNDNKIDELDLNDLEVASNEDLYENVIGAELYDRIFDELRKEPTSDLEMLFVCLVDYRITKPQEIEKELQWDIIKINNLKKKLRRRILSILEKM